MNMLQLSHVSKKFGGKTIIKDISLQVETNKIFGFIGQNGAGKTTTMKMILGLLKPDSGEIYVNGEKVQYGANTTNQYIGYLPDVPEFYSYMTPIEYLQLCGEITGMPKSMIASRTEELLEMVGLLDVKKRIQGFSRGMKQRLGIAQALMNQPKLLICDEPTSALDPIGRKEIIDILLQAKKETTVIFSTHILSDVERICDEIAFLHDGEIVLSGTLEDIKAARKGNTVEIEFVHPKDCEPFLVQQPKAKQVSKTRVVCEKKTEEDMLAMMAYLTNHKISVQRLEMMEPTLEELFVEVAGK